MDHCAEKEETSGPSGKEESAIGYQNGRNSPMTIVDQGDEAQKE
jgi:hypothetical protein